MQTKLSFIIKLQNNSGFQWFSYSLDSPRCIVHAKGYVFKDGTLYYGQSMSELFADLLALTSLAEIQQQVEATLRVLNGSFVVVIQGHDWLIGCVDRVRSWPLFYGFGNDNVLCLSDDANWVKKQIADTELDQLSTREFVLTGYVTGPDTLFPNVKQLQAGEYFLYASLAGKATNFLTCRYYRWLHENFYNLEKNELLAELDRIHLQAFRRLIESTRGRTLIVPLSGGYDSRLIVSILKRLRQERVICFSYGRQGDSEVRTSREVARRLGYPWLYIPYSFQRWRRWAGLEAFAQYCHSAASLSAIPHIQDWPAVMEMKDNQLIPTDAVFVPGHTGDFISGGHIPTWIIAKSSQTNSLAEAIRTKHYKLWKLDSECFEMHFLTKLRALGFDEDYSTPEEVASAFECWEWQERQAKFIINSVRIYEFWGSEWRLPLWDNEVMAFWARIPLSYRLRKLLYNSYCEDVFRAAEIDFDANSFAPLISRIPRISRLYSIYMHTYFGRFHWSDLFDAQEKFNSLFPAQAGVRRLMDPILCSGVNTLEAQYVLKQLVAKHKS